MRETDVGLVKPTNGILVASGAAGPTIDTTPVTENIGSGLIALAASGGAELGFMALRQDRRLVNSSVYPAARGKGQKGPFFIMDGWIVLFALLGAFWILFR